ncbi:formate dehydrogenase subunit delta [Acidisoma sp. C75]
MSRSPEDKLITMANQIARQLRPRGNEAAAEVAAHILDFWTPKMRAQLAAIVAAGDSSLDPLVQSAVRQHLPPAPGR